MADSAESDSTFDATAFRSVVIESPFDDFVRRFGTIQRRGIFGYLVHHLGRAIISGRYPVDSIMPNEPELVAEFGVSRTVVREAMKCLAGKGLIEIKTRVGTRVRDRSTWHNTDTDIMVWQYETGPTAEFMRYIKDLRMVLEPEAAIRAATRGTPAQFARLEAAYGAMAAAGNDLGRFVTADLDFHRAIFDATANPVLAHLYNVVAVAIFANNPVLRPLNVKLDDWGTLEMHKAIMDGILARDATAAAAATRHLLDVWKVEKLGK